MARNKYPQETIDKILSVAARLFVEKGYENTSIQDILEQLGGLTKGAIYHHFSSKEDIIRAVMEKQYQIYDQGWMEALRTEEQLTGLEKLRRMLKSSVASPRQRDTFQSAPQLLNNPKMLAIELKELKEQTAPQWIEPIIREGIADGSIKTDYPKELAEVLLLLTNIWVPPIVYGGSSEELNGRVRFFAELMKSIGLDLVDEEMIEDFEQLTALYKH